MWKLWKTSTEQNATFININMLMHKRDKHKIYNACVKIISRKFSVTRTTSTSSLNTLEMQIMKTFSRPWKVEYVLEVIKDHQRSVFIKP